MTEHVLITGCSTGIGYATAHYLQKQGYKVVAACRKQKDCDRLQSEGLMTVLLDVNSSDSIQDGFESAMAKLEGRIDVLINNAGYAEPGAIEDIKRDQLRHQFETNVFGLIELTQKVIPLMRKQDKGVILNVSSILAVVAIPFKGAYVASKFALDGVTDSLRLELIDTNIKIVSLNPGPIDTHFRKNARDKFETHQEHYQHSYHQKIYTDAMAPQRYDKVTMSISSETVAKRIFKIIRKRHPRARYFITIPAHFFAWAKRLLPTCLLDRVLARVV